MKMLIDRAEEEFLKRDKRKMIAYGEGSIEEWFKKNYKSLGFDRILKKQWNKTPDFIMLKDGKEVKVEIEFRSSSFIKHKHKVSEVDYVVCCVKDVELDKSIKVISLNHIFISYNDEIYPAIDPCTRPVSVEEMRSLFDIWDKPKRKEPKTKKPKPQRIKFPRILTEMEVARMFKAAEGRPRDCMLLKCLYYLGLKSSELRDLRVEDIDTENSMIRVNGKRERKVKIPGGFSFELEKHIRGREGLVFTGRGLGETISDRHIRRIVKRYARVADVRNCEEIKPHTLRISYANHLRKDGIPTKVIQEMLGHARRETTIIYTHGLSKIESEE